MPTRHPGWTAALLLLASCGKPPEPPPPNRVPQAPATVSLAEDRSLSVAQYVDRGVPAPDRDWGPEDYGRAVDALRKVAAEDVHLLPRVDSPRSGELMARIVSTRNLEVLKNETLPIEQRMPLVNGFMTSTKGLLLLYAEPESRGTHFDPEIVELLNHETRVARHMLGLGIRFVATLPPEEAASPVRRGGWEKMWNGTAITVSSRLGMLAERSHYRPAERRLLAKALGELLGEFFAYLPEMTRREVPIRLDELIRDEPHAEVRAALEAAKKTVTGPLPAPAAGPPKTAPEAPAPSAPSLPPGARLLKSQAGTPGPDGWYAAEASDQTLSIAFPQPYNELVLEADDKDGAGKIRMLTLGARAPGGATFSVMYVARLDGKLAKANPLESFVEDYKAKGDLRKVATVTVGSWEGREIELWTRQSESRARVLVKGSRIITLIVEVPFGQGAALQRDADRFFASFKVKD